MADESGDAWGELVALLADIETEWARDERGLVTADERAEARMFAMNALHHALQFWSQSDPARPWFYRWFSPTKKLLGDNPDTVYYGTVIDPALDYVIRGNLGGAVYTSFTAEAGTAGGNMSQALASTLNDNEFEVNADGSYEIQVSQHEQPGNWLKLTPDAGSITTRHYFEFDRPAATDPTLDIPLLIEPTTDTGEPPIPDDVLAASNIRRAITFLRSVTVDWPTPAGDSPIPWVSNEVNSFTNPARDEGNRQIGYAAADNEYRSTRYSIAPDEALEIVGRFPRCRFANVVLNNRWIQTPPYRKRRCSLNRRQTVTDADGTFRMILAHRDPGVPNWIDIAGAETGTIFWRFLLPEEPLTQLDTRILPIGEV